MWLQEAVRSQSSIHCSIVSAARTMGAIGSYETPHSIEYATCLAVNLYPGTQVGRPGAMAVDVAVIIQVEAADGIGIHSALFLLISSAMADEIRDSRPMDSRLTYPLQHGLLDSQVSPSQRVAVEW